MTAGFAGTRRFQIVRTLGQGGMGLVLEAFDRDQGGACALKLLPRVTPAALLRFKREFRALQGLSHPNLITLGELLNEGEHWFFTMELVHGVDFLTWVRGAQAPTEVAPPTATMEEQALPSMSTPAAAGPTGFDAERLSAALGQLAEGLRFLHESGKVHRDVKPSNVLVTPQGRVVLLDFGLVGELGDPDTGALVGTPGYMAPEYLLRGEITAATDLYAVGAVLFRVLTGVLPPVDASMRGALMASTAEAPRASALVPSVPPLLDTLCSALLAPDPGGRPSARELLARVGGGAPDAPDSQPPFVGRQAEVAHLLRAYRDSARRSVSVLIDGPSGIGKTALLDELVVRLQAEPEPPLVLRGRCYENEGIPYKAIDGVIDVLGDVLTQAPATLLGSLPAAAPLLSVLFPALRRIPSLAGGDDGNSGMPLPAEQAYQTRRGAERAARELFTALARWRPLVIVIDDFQWSDPDSATFLRALTRAPEAPPLLLVLSSRQHQQPTLGEDVRRLNLAALAPAEARALAADLLGQAAGSASAAAIAEEAGGNPFFVSELAYRAVERGSGQARLEELVWERVEACPAEARRVLELIAVAAAPIPQRVIAEAAGLSPTHFPRLAYDLRGRRLVRTGGLTMDDFVESHHDRVREAVMAQLPPAAKRAHHLSLGRVLEVHAPEDLDALVTHFEGGGDLGHAGRYAARAGDQAARALAFDRAAQFYRRALEWLPPAQADVERLREQLADALANAGLGAEAAAEYQRAAERAAPAHALELRRRAAEHLLRSGRLDEGMAALADVLARMRVRMPRTPAQAFAALLLRRARVRLRGLDFHERPESTLAPADLFRADTLWAAAARLGPIDTIRAADFQARHLLFCLELGEPFRVARALLAEGAFAAMMGGPASRARIDQLMERARPLVERIQHPYATAMLSFTDGFVAYQLGHFTLAMSGLDRAVQLFRANCPGASHDIAVSERFVLDSLVNLGELGQLSRRIPLLLEDAERRGDLYLAAELCTGLPNMSWLSRDLPSEARLRNERGIAPWPRDSFYLQHYYHLLASVNIALYEGDAAAAFEAVERRWPELRISLLLNVQGVRTEALFLRGRAALAQGSPSALTIASKMADALAHERVAWAPGLAGVLRAGLAVRARRGHRASALLRGAEHTLLGAGAGLLAAACRAQRARLGMAELESEALSWMQSRGIVRPERFVQLMLPVPT